MSVFRIDTFVLPEAARDKFVRASVQTIELLREQPGFVRDQWFEKVSGPGEVNVITLVEWRDQKSVKTAVRAVRALHTARGFDAVAFLAKYGVRESRAVYVARDIPGADA